MGGISWLGRLLIFSGIFLIIFGLLFVFMGRIKFPGLPLDIYIKRENFQVFIPIGSSIIISIILTIILNLIILLFLRK